MSSDDELIETLTLALESVVRWTNRHDLDPADVVDAVHSVARVALSR